MMIVNCKSQLQYGKVRFHGIFVTLGFILYIVSAHAVASALFYKVPNKTSIDHKNRTLFVKYSDGSIAKLSCATPKKSICRLDVLINKKRRVLDIDFSAHDAEPTFQYFMLAGASINDFTFTTSIKCQESYDKVFSGDMYASRCSILFSTTGEGLQFEEIQAEYISDPVSVE